MQRISKDHRRLRSAMTVADLIAELQMFPDDALVCFARDYGDICHTEQCMPVESADELERDEFLAESAYSKSGVAIERPREEDEDDDADCDGPDVVILR
jgi:hypothetical protein